MVSAEELSQIRSGAAAKANAQTAEEPARKRYSKIEDEEEDEDYSYEDEEDEDEDEEEDDRDSYDEDDDDSYYDDDDDDDGDDKLKLRPLTARTIVAAEKDLDKRFADFEVAGEAVTCVWEDEDFGSLGKDIPQRLKQLGL